ncbi:uncharacterized protein LTHEOB_1406 [Neofusicoccum parvum]|uniref:Uncharacterized protein LTHEOB_1406 n=1 Tax=Neofusicoccum parvum TaxID=310453 RepID=A0ACB5SBN8_9PEZI|nr:uncharacterized protein LTHEOB_1406 [Neofusicoccum parvum]
MAATTTTQPSTAAAAAAGPAQMLSALPPQMQQRGQSDRARSFRRTQYKKSAKARLEELVREITASRHEREALADPALRSGGQLDESIKLLHDRHAALEVWSQELRCGERSRSRSTSRTRAASEGPE